MTFFALDGSVHAYKRKAGKVVVEENLVMPAFLVVAIFTLLAMFSLMHIIFFVAVNTVGLKLIFFDFSLVAI